MGTERDRGRARDRLAALVDSGLDTRDVRLEAIAHLKAATDFERWCWPVGDPASLLGHSGIAEVDYFPSLPRMIVLDQADVPVSKTRLAGARRPAVSLHSATRGDLARDPRWDECQRQYGMGDELTIACRDEQGCWGWLQLHRDTDQAPFAPEDVEFAGSVAGLLGTLMRRALARQRPRAAAAPPPPGVVIIDAGLQVTAWTPAAQEWMRLFPGAALYEASGILPTAVYSAAARSLVKVNDSVAGLPTRMRARTEAGHWATFDGAPLEGDASGRAVVTIRSSTPHEVLDLLSRTSALTPRESQLLSLLLTGLSTRELAEHLYISQYTVKDHLKKIFDKVGVRSRRELVGQITGHVGASEADPALRVAV